MNPTLLRVWGWSCARVYMFKYVYVYTFSVYMYYNIYMCAAASEKVILSLCFNSAKGNNVSRYIERKRDTRRFIRMYFHHRLVHAYD